MKKSVGRQRKRKSSHEKGRLKEVVGLLLIALGILTALALLSYRGEPESTATNSNILGQFGAHYSYLIIQLFFGRWPAFIFPVLFFIWAGSILFKWNVINSLKYSGGLVAIAFWIAFTIGLAEVSHPSSEHAGLIGVTFSAWMYAFMGAVGSWIIWIVVILVGLILLLRLKPSEILQYSWQILKSTSVWLWKHRPRRMPKFKIRGGKIPVSESTVSTATGQEKESTSSETPDLFDVEVQSPPPRNTARPATAAPKRKGIYLLPPTGLLAEPSPESPDAPDLLKEKAKRLQDALSDFGVGAKVVRVNPGPVITRFDLEPDPGVKVSRITNLADDLALVLRAKAIRIQAPIPGQGAVGVEIPNRHPSIVAMRSIAEDPLFADEKSPLLIALGCKASGKPYVSDLAKMPHLLVAGTTGSGKSVCLNAIIASLLLRNPPEKLQFVIIDPKKLELSIYARLARHHLLSSEDLDEEVITTPANAVRVLDGVEMEMGRRYDILASAGVRNIEEFNKLAEQDKAVSPEGEIYKPLCYLIVVVDELADLMIIAAKQVEEPIARLAQMARAVGIHLIVATQRPSVDVITGVIKANFPARLAFQVASKIDSRTILDVNGADTLLGNGDALFIPPGRGQPERIHCCYVGPDEIEAIVSHIEDQPCDFYRHPLLLPQPEGMSANGDAFDADRDEFFEEAARMVIRQGQASVSILQRRLKIGYARAGRLIDQLERAGIVGPFDGSKAREVLIDEEAFDSRHRDDLPPL